MTRVARETPETTRPGTNIAGRVCPAPTVPPKGLNSLVALAVATLYVAMGRNRSESDPDSPESKREESKQRIEGKAKIGPAEDTEEQPRTQARPDDTGTKGTHVRTHYFRA